MLPIRFTARYNGDRYPFTNFGKSTMQYVFSTPCLLLALTLPIQAGDKAKPNTLTPKEIADGWILLFDGETTFGWSSNGKYWLKEKGILQSPGGEAALRLGTGFQSFALDFEYDCGHRKSAKLYLTPANSTNKEPDGDGILLPEEKGWHHAIIQVQPNQYVGKATDANGDVSDFPPTKRMTATQLVHPTFVGAELKIKNLKLRPLGANSLFNGKDLTGWREFPGRKSKFTVTDNGEINVKDGNGDLQTIGKYQDFVLQLECISNGKYLNSGIFFRCKDNEYQNGYEAQIFNKFTPTATQEYTIEEYDPKTNMLLEKKKVKSTAVDFGTGAIYRRIPARKEMSKDGEWFGMTIVAQGNHLATWVNGVLVVDWYDNRPKSDNPRTGCRLEGGHISIQGHDPTTNLSFRKLRIAELPAAK